MLASVALLAVSCSGGEDAAADEVADENEVVEAVTYTVDTEASVLNWHGEEGPEHFHTGTVKFSEGSLTMKGDEVESGSFTVDMMSIGVTDEMPEDKVGYLIGHLQNEDFFNAASFPTVSVTLGEYTDGQLETTINVLGTDLTNRVPVSIGTTEDGATMSGEFTIDFASLNMPGFAENEEEPEETISSEIKFKLDLVLTK